MTASENSAMSVVDNNISHSNLDNINTVSTRLHHHNRFALAMRKGTQAINKRNY